MAEIELKFDPIVKDIALAEEYFEKNNNEFQSIPPKDAEMKVVDHGNKIYVVPKIELDSNKYMMSTNLCENTTKELAKKLRDNAKLFGQLELLTRNIPEEETEQASIELILKNLEYNQTGNTRLFYKTSCIVFDDDCPLAVLGHAFQNLVTYGNAQIVATLKTAPVATLFVQLCRDVGYEVNLILASKEVIASTENVGSNKEFARGCAGVVTESSDIPSAVEAFIASFSQNPWRIKRILVQENVYETFKQALQWKCKYLTEQIIQEDVKNMCAVVYQLKNKTFLIDYTGADKSLMNREGIVLVEAYRTTQELLTLLKCFDVFCVSLWCNDIATANKIAYSNTAPITWINDYASFNGHSSLSQAFYAYPTQDCDVNIENVPKNSITREQLVSEVFTGDDNVSTVFREILSKSPYAGAKEATLESHGLNVVMTTPSQVIFVTYRSLADVSLVAEGLSIALKFNCILFIEFQTKHDDFLQIIKKIKNVMGSQVCFVAIDDQQKSCKGKNMNRSWYKTKSVFTKFNLK